MEAAKENIPALRFPEFSGEWKSLQLRDVICKMQSGLSRKLSDSDIGLPVIRSNNITDGQVSIEDIKFWYREDNQGAKTGNYYLKEGDILVNFINSIAQIGKAAIYRDRLKRDVIYTTNILRISTKEHVSNKFIFSLFQRESYNDFISSITKPAVNQASFTTKDFQLFSFYCPDLSEQEKIASFLTSIDDKISQLKKKKELLELYKKGVMQQIFSQQIRFKDDDGKDYPDWEEKRLSEIFTFKQGVQCGVEKQYLEWREGKYRFIRIVDLTNKEEPLRYIDSPGPQHILNKSDLFMVRYGSPGLVGFNMEGVIANNLFRLIPIYPIEPNFYFHQLSYLQDEIKKLASSTTMPALNFSSLGLLKLIEPTISEQKVIALFLTSIEVKIKHVTEQIFQTQSFKKGLLQQMFV